MTTPSTTMAGVKPTAKKKCLSPSTVDKYMKTFRSPHVGKAPGLRLASRAEGNIVVVEADPDLLVLSNFFDLSGTAILFQPVLRGRYTYDVSRAGFQAEATDSISLKDDDSYELAFQDFEFPFGKTSYRGCFINSNGNITFERPDSDPPNADNLVDGPPRIAALFTDLDPEGSGTVLVHQTPESVAISWLGVPEFFNHDQFNYGQNTFQIILYRDGRIELIYSDQITATEAFTGILPAPGKSRLRLVDFSKGIAKHRPSLSFAENFHDYESIDIPDLMKSLYRNIPDEYDFVTLLSNFDLIPVPGALAFAINVQNTVEGIGDPSESGSPIFNNHSTYGSRDTLQNITFLGNIHQYPPDPGQEIEDEDTSLLEILAHEVAHRWLSYVEILRDGRSSGSLLGRDLSHWNFFLDTNGSFLEGNQIEQKSSRSFFTESPFQGYSALDLYLMGFLAPEEVQDSFLVEDASAFSPDFPFSSESEPEPDVSFRGTAVTVRIDDIIAANGSRNPSVSDSQKEFRHLFVLIVKSENPASHEDLRSVDLLRTAWESFFSQATGGVATIDTRVR